MNRIASGRFPNTLEGVVYQRGQFTPAMNGKLGRILNSNRIPASCYEAAQDAMNGANPVGNALFFNTGRVGSRGYKLGDHYFR
jgi:N-acetylmuramoyl-L-alanine amidase